MFKVISVIAALLCAAQLSFALHKFEPPNGRILHGAGQTDLSHDVSTNVAINAAGYIPYVNSMPAGSLPVLNSFYTVLDSGQYSDGTYLASLNAILGQSPNYTLPLICLNLNNNAVGYDDGIAAGNYDTRIHQLASFLKAIGRPTYLRIGAEMNGPWEGYHVGSFPTAYQRIVNILRGDGVTNVAYVFCIDPDGGDYTPWYPGSSYVDWFGIDLFSANSFSEGMTGQFMSDAAGQGMPVMIAESDPVNSYPTGEAGLGQGDISWNGWYAQYFNFINSNPGIKAEFYINYNWPVIDPSSNWPDAFLEDDGYVLNQWILQVEQAKYISSQTQQQLNSLLGLGGGATSGYGGPSSAVAGAPISITGSGSTSYGSVSTYRWNFVSGPVSPVFADPLSNSTLATFPVPGAYNLSFIVTDNQGNSSTSTFTVNVSPAASAGTGTYLIGFHLPNSQTVAANILILAPDGTTASTTCSASPCSMTFGKAPGDAVMQVFYLNGSNQQLATSGPLLMPIN